MAVPVTLAHDTHTPDSTRCIVCDRCSVIETTDVLEGTLCEAESQCTYCGYYSSYSYGGSTEVIGFVSWAWHHTESKKSFRYRSTYRQAVLAETRELVKDTGVPPFLAAIEQAKKDKQWSNYNTAVLVFADWLEEHRIGKYPYNLEAIRESYKPE